MTRPVSQPFFAATLAALAFAVTGAMAQGTAPRTVYLYPMSNGFDQYLAGQIAREHVLQVVADPKIADTVMTDRLNDALSQNLTRLHPRKDETVAEETTHSFRSSAGKGTLFLIDAKSRQVIWSDYEKPRRNAAASYLHSEAARVVKKLAATLNPPAAK